MTDSSENISNLRQQAVDILTHLLGNGLNADSGAKWADLIMRATTETELNNMVGLLNAIASSQASSQPSFIEDQGYSNSPSYGIDVSRFRIK